MVSFSKTSFLEKKVYGDPTGLVVTLQIDGSPITYVEILRKEDWEQLDHDDGYRAYLKAVKIGKCITKSHNDLARELEEAREVISAMSGHITSLELKLYGKENG